MALTLLLCFWCCVSQWDMENITSQPNLPYPKLAPLFLAEASSSISSPKKSTKNVLFLPDLSQDFSFLALGFHPPWPWAIQRAHLCFALKSGPRNGVAKRQGCSHSGVTRTKLLEEKLMILRKKKSAWGGLSSVWHITRDIWRCLGTWTTSAASPHALGVGYALLYILCKNHFTFWRVKIHLVHMPFHLQPKRKSQKKLYFYCSSRPLISLHFPCLCVCGNVHFVGTHDAF